MTRSLNLCRGSRHQCEEEQFAQSRALLQPYIDNGSVVLVQDFRCAKEFQELAYNHILAMIRTGGLADWCVVARPACCC